jgi:hypothetical protein
VKKIGPSHNQHSGNLNFSIAGSSCFVEASKQAIACLGDYVWMVVQKEKKCQREKVCTDPSLNDMFKKLTLTPLCKSFRVALSLSLAFHFHDHCFLF